MKKNKMMRMASGLLVLTLLTTCIISGTFAKYTSEAKGSDTARVAKWGVVARMTGSLFGTDYTDVAGGNTPVASDSGDTITVKTSDASNKVLAPGTSSPAGGLTFELSGTPEVATTVTAKITAQDVYLAKGTYAVMQKVNVSADTFATKLVAGLYQEKDGSYTKLGNTATYESTNGSTYYVMINDVTVGEGGYYPVSYKNTNNKFNKTKVTEIAKSIADVVNQYAEKKADKEDSAAIEADEDEEDDELDAGNQDLEDKDDSAAGVSYDVTGIFGASDNLSTLFGTNTITWEWKYYDCEDNDVMDTILGDLAAGLNVVQIVTTGEAEATETTITKLSVDKDTGIVNNGETEVGSTKTALSINITATQKD